MTPQLQQVAQTYLTRRSLWVVAAFALLSFGVSLAVSFLEPNEPIGALPIVGLAAAVTGYAIGIHAKWQFCNPRARLMPGFNRPHIAILLALLIIGCVVYPLVVAVAARWSLLGALACSIAGTAAGIWAMHRPNALTIAAAFAIFLSFGTPPAINFYVFPAPTPTVTTAHLAILVLAWGSIAYWLRRLSVVGEEDVDYLLPTLAQDGARGRLAGKQASCARGRPLIPGSWQSRLADAWHNPAANVPATTIAARQRLLRDGPLATPPGIRAAGLAAMFLGIVVVAALIGLGFSAGFGLDSRDNEQMVGIMILMTAAMGGSQLEVRRARMSQELLLPLRRQDYLNGLLAAAAHHALTIWITTQAAVIAYIALFMPDRFFPGYIAAVTALSLGLHTCMFGALISIARKNSGNVRIVAYLMVLIPATAALIIGDQHLPRPVATAAEREQLVQEQYAEAYAKIDAFLQPDTKQKLLEHFRNLVGRRFDGPANPYVPWTCATLLTAAGLVAFLDGRKRWLKLELG